MFYQNRKPILLLLDWDGTLTKKSTLLFIASIATSPQTHPELAGLSKAYAEGLKTHDQIYRPMKQERKTIAQELAYLSSLDSVEKCSIERIEAAGIFKDAAEGDVKIAASKAVERGDVTLRSGWERMVGSIHERKGKVGIVSVAWSQRFIISVLEECGRKVGGSDVRVGDVDVRANEILLNGSGKLNRYFEGQDKGIWTAADKKRVVDEMVTKYSGEGSGARPMVLYIGDSPTDLPCLLGADVGICVRDRQLTSEQEALRETLERVDVECLGLRTFKGVMGGKDETADGKSNGNEQGMRRQRVWWARDFEEVCQSGILDGPQGPWFNLEKTGEKPVRES